jgi:sugar fermentation stimulation protein A
MNTHSFPLIPWPELVSGTLIRRYKRFLADVRLADGRTVTAHCPNTGSMKGCCEPGRPVYLSVHDNPKRKLKFTWELIQMPTSLVGVNTGIPNRLVYESLRSGAVSGLAGYPKARREVTVSRGSRIDIRLEDAAADRRCYIEVKNCTLVEDDAALFPDAVTDRGRRHLEELQRLVDAGNRCAMFFLVQRTDAKFFAPAASIDPAYARELVRSVERGVEVFSYDVHIDLKGIRLKRPLPLRL